MLNQTMINPGSMRQPVSSFRAPAPSARQLTGSNSIELMGAPMPFARNAEIYGENEPAEYLYKVLSGTVRTYKVLNDGRRPVSYTHLRAHETGRNLVCRL